MGATSNVGITQTCWHVKQSLIIPMRSRFRLAHACGDNMEVIYEYETPQLHAGYMSKAITNTDPYGSHHGSFSKLE